MFRLKPFSPPDILLARELAPSMKETVAFNTPTALGAGYTFFGQFIDHDLTLDLTPLPSAKVDISTLVNSRTPYFDLDSVYGGGPAKSPAALQRKSLPALAGWERCSASAGRNGDHRRPP